jgi:hypothetical protein
MPGKLKGPNEHFDNEDGTTEIKVVRDNGEEYFILIDTTDYPLVSKYRWFVIKTHSLHKSFYAMANWWAKGKHKAVYMHRLIAKPAKNKLTDHKDGNGLRNVRSNLRSANDAQSLVNRIMAHPSKSGFRGVYKRGKKFYVMFSYKNKTRYFGTFNDREEAARIYDLRVLKLYQDFAVLNFPEHREEYLKELEAA